MENTEFIMAVKVYNSSNENVSEMISQEEKSI
jgi:hypothetical protein